MKRLMAAAAAVVMLLAGCSSDHYDGNVTGPLDTFEKDVTLNDGRMVHCLFWAEGHAYNGLSCDWAHIRENATD